MRLLITGASGSGTTTLGSAVAERLAVPHADVDDYFWMPTSPPYTTKRPIADRISLMESVFAPRDSWVLSGSLVDWGGPVVRRLDAVVLLTLDPAIRLCRLKSRETVRYGSTIEPGGANEAAHQEFYAWASGYDDPKFAGHSRAGHEEWLSALTCPVLRLDAQGPVKRQLEAVRAWLESDLIGATPRDGVRRRAERD
ncbi:AAA family ATPase [Pengzhenrongella phosphoraccumulans]|uniref:AAA family ATPase n=1 Tax=Pengzhenrongella phosphoraccumulans TaxID=3114394 RepID=UPI0038908ED6